MGNALGVDARQRVRHVVGVRIAIEVADVDRRVVYAATGHMGRKHQAVVDIGLSSLLDIGVHLDAEGMLKGKAVAVARDERTARLAIGEHIAIAIRRHLTRA